MPISHGRETITPTVSRIVEAVLSRIESGEYRTGEWLPTERVLADEFRVSRILVRSAVQELARRGAIECMMHRRPVIRLLQADGVGAAQQVRSIALWIWPGPSWPACAMILQAVQSALAPGQRVVLGNATSVDWSSAVSAEAAFLDQIARDPSIEGLITAYMGAEENLACLERVRLAGVPIVFIDHLPPTGFEADYVGVNNALGAERIVRHLAREGHRVIAHVSNYESVSTIAERCAGYRRAVARLNLAADPELLQRDPGPSGDDASEGCEGIVSRLLSLPEPPTAIIAASDVIAYRVIAALQRLGRSVPEDISVTGFDGVERWGPTPPFLTTVSQPFEEIGAYAVELLSHRSKACGGNEYRHIILEARLAVQRSTRRLEAAPSE